MDQSPHQQLPNEPKDDLQPDPRMVVYSKEHQRREWTGFGKKTLWDWLQLLIVPFILAILGLLFTWSLDVRQQEAEANRAQAQLAAEEQRAQGEALQAYLEEMGNLLLDRDLRTSDVAADERYIARARTLTILGQVDAFRKRSVLQFLQQSQLIRKEPFQAIVQLNSADLRYAALSGLHLWKADLSSVDLSNADLSNADVTDAVLWSSNLSGVNLTDATANQADMSDTHLSGAILHHTYLYRTNLSDADLTDADLTEGRLLYTDLSNAYLTRADLTDAGLVGADLSNAELSGADLSNANLSGADLTDATVTEEQLSKVRADHGLEDTIMPDGSKHP